ncbi:MerR family transcriptional regulator [Celeribacter sp. ULVN23_4]
MDKSPDAFRTISEVADWLDTPAHVLRFWESRFTQVKPVKRAGGRRYYRPSDMALLGGIKKLLHDDGMTIRGVQKLLREHGVKYVASLSPVIDGVDPIAAPAPEKAPIPPAPMAEMVPQDDFEMPEPEERVIPFTRPAPEAAETDVIPQKKTTGLPGQSSFDFDLGSESVSDEEPELFETSEEDETIAEDVSPALETAAYFAASEPADDEAADDETAETDDTSDDTFSPPDQIEGAPEITEELAQAPAEPLGPHLLLQYDPEDDDPIEFPHHVLLGQLNHRQLSKVAPDEIADLLVRAQALKDRLAS